MVYQSYYQPMYVQPVGSYYVPYTSVGNAAIQPTGIRGIAYKVNEYFFKGLVYIQHILDVLLSTGPFFEQYGPLLEEVPKMYHLMKAINEASNEEDEITHVQVIDDEFDGPAPKLFI